MAGITCSFPFKPVISRRRTTLPTLCHSSPESKVCVLRRCCSPNFVKRNFDPSVSSAFQNSITARYGGYRQNAGDSRNFRETWKQPELEAESSLYRSSIRSASVRLTDAQQIGVVTNSSIQMAEKAEHKLTKVFAVSRRTAMALLFSSSVLWQVGLHNIALAQPSVGFREYIDTFDGYTFKYPQNWIQVRGAGADIFFRDPFVLDENLSVELSSPSSSKYKSVEDLGPPQEAGEKVLRQYLTEFMSTRLGVRRESNILSTSSTVADDGRIYYQVEVNIKSYANNNELAVMPQERIARLEWNRRYLSVLGVENNRLYELRLQTPENVFLEEENDIRRVMDSFRVIKVAP